MIFVLLAHSLFHVAPGSSGTQAVAPGQAISPGIVDAHALAHDAVAGQAQSHDLQRNRRSRAVAVTKYLCFVICSEVTKNEILRSV